MKSERKLQDVIKDAETEIKRLKFMLASSPAVTYVCEAFGVYADTFISDNVTEVLGYQPSDFLDNPGFWADLIHPDDKESILNGLKILLEKDYHIHEYRFQHKDGSYRWMRDELKLIRDADGEPFEMIGSWSDITSRKQAEEELIDATQTIEHLLGTSAVMIYKCQPFGDYSATFITDNIKEILGYEPDEFVNEPSFWANRIHPNDAPRVFAELPGLFENGYHIHEYRFVHKDGSYRWMFDHLKLIKNAEGTPQDIIGSFVDITERKQNEEALIKSEAKHRALFENSRDAIYVSSKEGKLIDVNQAMLDLFGYTREEMVGLDVLEIYLNLFDRKLFQQEIENKRSVKDYEIEFKKKDGTLIDCLVTSTLQKDKEGTVIGYQGVIRDITNRKRLEAQLRQSHKMEAIGTMAGGIAHDFNNILSVILGNADMALISLPEGNPARHRIDQIFKASHRATNLVRQILTFSRRDECVKRPYYLCRLIEEIMGTLRATISTTVKIKINIPAKCHDNIAECKKVNVDPTQIHQLLFNLCINAVQAMDDEKGILEISLTEETIGAETVGQLHDVNPGTYEYLTVSDTGSGIDSTCVEKIFDPFFTTKEVGIGTGMGLSVVHGIIEGHNGKVFVDSELGKGTTFHIYFPITEIESDEETEVIESLPTGNESILLVDDEEDIVESTSMILESLGYTVTTLFSSTAALEKFKSQKDDFDLIITDMAMPDLTGVELSIELLKIRPEIPIILCTGFSSLISKEKVQEIGICEYCMKPLDRKQLAHTVREVLDKNKA